MWKGRAGEGSSHCGAKTQAGRVDERGPVQAWGGRGGGGVLGTSTPGGQNEAGLP